MVTYTVIPALTQPSKEQTQEDMLEDKEHISLEYTAQQQKQETPCFKVELRTDSSKLLHDPTLTSLSKQASHLLICSKTRLFEGSGESNFTYLPCVCNCKKNSSNYFQKVDGKQKLMHIKCLE